MAALTVRGVAAEAGVVPRYFYEEFGGVDEFARQLFDREFDAGIARVGEAVAAAGTLDGDSGGAAPTNLERVEAAVGAVLDFVTEAPDRAALLLTQASGAGVLAERRQQRMDDVVAVVAAFARGTYGAADGPQLSADDQLESDRALRSAAAFVAGGLSHTVDEWLRGRVERERGVLQRELAAQIVAVGDTASALVRQAREAG